MPETNLQQLAVRLAYLENRCVREARLKSVMAGILMCGVLLTIGATPLARTTQSTADRITAREIVLVDQKGQVRTRLGIGQGGLSLVMSDAGGLPRIAIGVAQNGDPQISLLGKRKGFPRINLAQAGEFQTLTLENEETSFISLLQTDREAKLWSSVGSARTGGGSESTFGFFASSGVAAPSLGAQLIQDGKVLWRVPEAAGRGK